MRNDKTSLPTRRSARSAERRLRRRPAMVLTTLTATVAIAGMATAMAPVPMVAGAADAGPVMTRAAYTEAVTTVADVDSPAQQVDEAIAGAQAAITAAQTIHADIAASGLTLAVEDQTVETTELEAAVASLQAVKDLPLFNDHDAVEAVVAATAPVSEEAAALRGHLDAAIAAEAERVAAEEAARAAAEAEAARAAEQAAAAAAAKKSSGSSSSGGSAALSGGAVGGTSPADAQATARGMIGGYGWGEDQFQCLVKLWNKESGWNYRAQNKSSGAYGIPQALPGSKMASAGADWQTNPATQIAWGLGYISGRYGTPCGAWAKSQSVGWY